MTEKKTKKIPTKKQLKDLKLHLLNLGMVLVDITCRLDATEKILHDKGILDIEEYQDSVSKLRSQRLSNVKARSTDEETGTAAPVEYNSNAED